MPLIRLELVVAAPPEVCFDLAIDVDAHQDAFGHTGERVVAGVMSGPMALGDEVTWEAVHFGVRQRLTARITAYERPHRFVDEMVHGAFARFTHEHRFEPMPDGTRVVDVFDYASPLGPLGWLADALFLEAYMTRLLAGRAAHLKRAAERSSMSMT